MMPRTIQAVVFDFGGVIADEGFRNGLYEIAANNGLDRKEFFQQAREIIYETGYITGENDEKTYWNTLRFRTGIQGADALLRGTLLKGFTVREWMIRLIRWLKAQGVRVAILSDQTNWLDELEEGMGIFSLFEQVFNSFHIGKTKRDVSLFNDVLQVMSLRPEEVVFVDDTEGHVERAQWAGINAICFTGRDDFLKALSRFFPELPPDL